MSFDFATFLTTIPAILDARLPVLVRGRHGVGKSEVVYAIAKQRGLPVVERRASQMTEGDLLGLPDTADLSDGRKATTWNAPDWLVTACTEPVVLFLDEVDRATMEVRQGLFELTDSRKINGWHLHPEPLIVAAVNGGEHGSQYQVGEMDPAELDRWTVFDVEPSVEDWLGWATGKVDPVLWDFINGNRQHLEHTDDYEPNKVYPSRRSWVRLSDALRSMGDIKQSPVLYHLASSSIGFEGAVAFNDFVANYKKIVTVENILDEGKIDLTNEFKINDHNALIERFKQSKVFDRELDPTETVNVAEYFVTLPSEIGMLFFQVVSKGSAVAHNAHGITLNYHVGRTLVQMKLVDP